MFSYGGDGASKSGGALALEREPTDEALAILKQKEIANNEIAAA